jgi:hypothetical protein
MRRFLRFCSALLIMGILFALLPMATVSAGPLESIQNDPKATIVHPEKTVVVTANGAVGSNIYITGRSFLSIDFDVQPGKQVTLLVITSAQKQEMDSGRPITGRPKVRTPIDGTASQSLTVDQGGYYVAILNSEPESVSVTYRVSARAF